MVPVWLQALHFDWPWMALALVLPWLAWRLLPAQRASARQSALALPDNSTLADIVGGQTAPVRRLWRWPLLLLAWVALVLAGMRPQWLTPDASAPVTGRNLMMAVDLSGSMEAKDFQLAGRSVTRLTATKAVGGDFIDRREGDRLGLILFGERAYQQAPLTFDRATLKTLLFEAEIGLAGDKTAIGDAIALAVKRVRDGSRQDEQHVLVLLTDGANTAGEIEPIRAAELARTVDLKIYTIGIGADPQTINGRFMRGLTLRTQDLDEDTLTRIAQTTGGRYFRARDVASLANIYRELDALEPAADEEDGYNAAIDVFFWPAGVGLALLGLLSLPQWFPGRSR
ncbi:MAG: VWA domain-containing protein [Pseudomonadota bacterium]